MCPPKDDLGVEYDAELEEVLKDPKSTILSKFLDYRLRRSAAEKQKADEEEAKKNPKKKNWFDIG